MPERAWAGYMVVGDGGLESLTSLRKTVDRYLVGRALDFVLGINGELSKLFVSLGRPLFGISFAVIFDTILASLSDGRLSALTDGSSSLKLNSSFSSFTSQVSIFILCSNCLRACSRGELFYIRVTGVF